MAVTKITQPEGGGVDVVKEKRVVAPEFGLDQKREEENSLETSHELEISPEESSGTREGESEGAVEPPTSTLATIPSLPTPKDPLTQKLEQVLEEDLKEVYLSMPPDKQRAFLQKGEELTGKIRIMIETTKFSFKKALKLIRDWLKMIPGVNKFFLEQEAKIKADKISDIAKEG